MMNPTPISDDFITVLRRESDNEMIAIEFDSPVNAVVLTEKSIDKLIEKLQDAKSKKITRSSRR